VHIEEQKSYVRFSRNYNFGNAYRENLFKESLENWSEDVVTTIVQTFCGLKKFG